MKSVRVYYSNTRQIYRFNFFILRFRKVCSRKVCSLLNVLYTKREEKFQKRYLNLFEHGQKSIN